MATLSSLLSTLAPGSVGNAPTFFRVYNTSINSVSNGGCCCLWTVPAGVTSVTFDVWAGGGSGSDGCCCSYQAYGGSSGQFTTKTIDTQAGCQYRICAGGSGACAYNVSNCGCIGCSSYVVAITGGSNVLCAEGGDSGNAQPGFTSPFSSYSCCWGRINGGDSNSKQGGNLGDYYIPGVAGGASRNQFCFTHYYYYTSGGHGSSHGRSYTLCDTTWYGSGRQKHNGDAYRNQFPAGPGFSAIGCGGTHDYSTGGAGGLVIVSYQ